MLSIGFKECNLKKLFFSSYFYTIYREGRDHAFIVKTVLICKFNISPLKKTLATVARENLPLRRQEPQRHDSADLDVNLLWWVD